MSPNRVDISYAHFHFKWYNSLDVDCRSERGDQEMRFIDLFSGIGGFSTRNGKCWTRVYWIL